MLEKQKKVKLLINFNSIFFRQKESLNNGFIFEIFIIPRAKLKNKREDDSISIKEIFLLLLFTNKKKYIK